MQLLEAINAILRASQKAAIHDMGEGDQDSQQALRTLRESRQNYLSHGFKFNTRKISLSVNSSGFVPVAAAYLKVIFRGRDDHLCVQPDLSDDLLKVWNNDTDAWHDATVDDVTIVFDIGTDPAKEITHFAMLPQKMAYAICRKAAAAFWQEVNGSSHSGLMAEAIRAESLWINSQDYDSLKVVSGADTLAAFGGGGTISNYDPRTQSFVR